MNAGIAAAPALLHHPRVVQFEHGELHTAQLGQWQLVWAFATGRRHLAQNKGCEDACGVRVVGGTGVDDSEDAPQFAFGRGLHVALADGVSASQRADHAAKLCVQACLDAPTARGGPEAGADADAYRQALLDVNALLEAQADESGQVSAATLAAAWLGPDGRGWVNRVGDCRVYSWSPSQPEPVAVLPDQTYELLGEAAGLAPVHNPARALGARALGVPELVPLALEVGSGVMLCSDGLHRQINGVGLTALSQANSDGCVQAAGSFAQSMVQGAVQRGFDDVSLVLAWRVQASPLSPERLHPQSPASFT